MKNAKHMKQSNPVCGLCPELEVGLGRRSEERFLAPSGVASWPKKKKVPKKMCVFVAVLKQVGAPEVVRRCSRRAVSF